MDKPSFSPSLIGRIIPTSRSSKDESGDWRTWGNNEVADFVNNTRIQGVVRVFGPGFCEELPSLMAPRPPRRARIEETLHIALALGRLLREKPASSANFATRQPER
jgi:hypothetical protein